MSIDDAILQCDKIQQELQEHLDRGAAYRGTQELDVTYTRLVDSAIEHMETMLNLGAKYEGQRPIDQAYVQLGRTAFTPLLALSGLLGFSEKELLTDIGKSLIRRKQTN